MGKVEGSWVEEGEVVSSDIIFLPIPLLFRLLIWLYPSFPPVSLDGYGFHSGVEGKIWIISANLYVSIGLIQSTCSTSYHESSPLRPESILRCSEKERNGKGK